MTLGIGKRDLKMFTNIRIKHPMFRGLALLHAPSSGLFLATDLAISVGLASASVGLASV